MAVATIGAVLPGDFKIKAVETCVANRLKGCCAPSLSWEFLTIITAFIELPADAPIGTDIREYLKLDDNTIEISVTPNRADCLGIIGVARDVVRVEPAAAG